VGESDQVRRHQAGVIHSARVPILHSVQTRSRSKLGEQRNHECRRTFSTPVAAIYVQ
jgi:hypothetical protein